MKMKSERALAMPLIFAGRLPILAPGQPPVPTAVNKLLCQTLAMIALVFGGDARAADSWAAPSTTSWATPDTKASAHAPGDTPAKAAPLRSEWTGFYVGAHVGLSSGHSAWSATQAGGTDLSGSLNFFAP